MRDKEFELAFEVSGLTEAIEDAIDASFDALVAIHGRTTKVTVVVPAVTAVEAADVAISTLNGLGVHVVRLIDELVTRTEIAQRAGVTTQAVGLWTRGERNADHEFPEPYVRAGSATLWLWGEVVTFLREIGKPIDGSMQFPSRSDIQVITGMLARDNRVLAELSWHTTTTVSTLGVFVRRGGRKGPDPRPTTPWHVVSRADLTAAR
ncbi:hypothetical protein [Georgenia yuyongxinii]|uniref:Uncharacterized protein n=1 Tax=Georgenia yuyongxinii TaxID=2589797 RepID=A0A552WXN1_9MICO|nr:hypothetical protein [Georgenia yuyongxinii]TRW47537.1 hypothetical protein FJ693_00020 [Georgenia yuyongxinii]